MTDTKTIAPAGTEAGFDLDRAPFEALFNTIHPGASIPTTQLYERTHDDRRYCSFEVEYAWQTYKAALIAQARAAKPAGAADTTASASGEVEAYMVELDGGEPIALHFQKYHADRKSREWPGSKVVPLCRASLAPVSAQQDDCNKCLQNGHWCAKDTCTGPVSAQQGAAIPADWCKDCVGQGIKTWPVPPDGDDTCETCNGTGAAKAPAAQADDLRLAICNIQLPVYGSNSFQHGFVSAKEAVLDLLSKRAASPASTPEAAPEHVATVEAGKFANRLQWVSDDAMASVPVGAKLYAATTAGAATTSEDARDAARYRYLRNQSIATDKFPPDNGSCWVVKYQHPKGTMPDTRSAGFGAQLDANIDSAMRATQQEGAMSAHQAKTEGA